MITEKKEASYNYRNRILFYSVILVLIGLIVIIYFLFFYSIKCENFDCFKKSLSRCQKTFYVREDANAIWSYEIRNSLENDICKVKVTLLNLKQGDISIEKIQGKSMTCRVFKNSNIFPEEDISLCTGILKEEIQEIIIQKTHNYLVKNLGEIQKEFEVI